MVITGDTEASARMVNRGFMVIYGLDVAGWAGYVIQATAWGPKLSHRIRYEAIRRLFTGDLAADVCIPSELRNPATQTGVGAGRLSGSLPALPGST